MMRHSEHFFACSDRPGRDDLVHRSSPSSRIAARGLLLAVETTEKRSLPLRAWTPKVDVIDTIWPISDSGLAESGVENIGWSI